LRPPPPQPPPPTSAGRVAILGSTGSIGTQTLEVIEALPDAFEITLLTAGNNSHLLIEQAIAHKPVAVVIANKDKYKEVFDALDPHDIQVYAGADALEQCMDMDVFDVVVTAMVGFAGLKPTLRAIKNRKTIALANKETLVVAGEFMNPIEKIYLTASGGPFRGKSAADLAHVTVQQALKHPNWEMGAKITIDSASMMNKGLEIIEARWLFNLQPEQIDVVVHPQSIVHSIVQFEDGSMKAQLGLPDMKLPIQYALSYPQRLANSFERFNFMNYPNLTFEQPDFDTFDNLNLAFEALRLGGNAPCVLNAANEITNRAFIDGRIGFLDIAKLNRKAMEGMNFVALPSLDDYLQTDRDARARTAEMIPS
jgi:1-deoxy-D-xylulose-5-phosphate reductoisomerase